MPRDFFAEKRGAAVLKHGILSRYVHVFAGKTGSKTDNGRVVFLDGYAGPGRYDDGSDGSPLLFVRAALDMEKWTTKRCIVPIFVELNPESFARLEEVLAEVAGDSVLHKAFDGDLGDRLGQVLHLAHNASLLAFLDPFGTALEAGQLRQLLTRTRKWPPTEVLLHVSVSTVARIGGIIRQARRNGRVITEPERKTIARVDRFLDGTWWHEYFQTSADLDDDATATELAMQVAQRFCVAQARATGHKTLTVPVRPQPDRAPKYVLTLFSRHRDGLWHFADATGRAGVDWQRAYHDRKELKEHERWLSADERKRQGQGVLFETREPQLFDPDTYRKENRAAWVTGIEKNIEDLLRRHSPFTIGDHVEEVYGHLFGQAWDMHVKEALKNLKERELIQYTPREKTQDITIRINVPTPRPNVPQVPGTGPRSGRPTSGPQPSGSARPTA